MKCSSGPCKTAFAFSASTDHQLNMYALAASAAGVGLLAVAQPAAAKIVYTPANINITRSYSLDLNNDGTADFTIAVYSTFFSGSGYREAVDYMYVHALQKSNAAVVGKKGFARAFRPRITIGPKQVFGAGTFNTAMAGCRSYSGPLRTSHTSGGPWLNVKNRYLGLRFVIKGKVHYGWARLSTTACARSGTLTGYAYETIPNKTIVTGKRHGPNGGSAEQPNSTSLTTPSASRVTLGILAAGSPALLVWRRKKVENAVQ